LRKERWCGKGFSVKILVRPIGIIKKYTVEQELDVEPGITSRILVQNLEIPPKLKMVSYVNGKKRGLDEELCEGDEVKLVTLLTGG
jgi:sulfur carrier protein ThiS